jgi:hypothetical protein
MYKFLGAALLGLAATTAAHSAVNYTTSVTIGYDPNAATSNFPGVGPGPGTTANETAYTIQTGIDATNFYVDVATTGSSGNDLTSYDFANIYVGGATFNDSLVVEVTNDRYAFDGVYHSLAGTGFTYSSTGNPAAGTADISFALPLAYLENDPLGLGFATPKLTVGDQVRVSYAQAYGYSFVGGSANYGADRLGSQIIPAPAPEPAAWALMIVGIGAIGGMTRRSLRRAALA